MPDFSLIIISHNKPKLIREAVQSVLAQTHRNWEAILVDSGALFRQGFFSDLNDPRLTIEESGETPELAKTKNMASWCGNRLLNSGRLRGELIMTLCDDDLLYPEAFATFWEFYTRHDKKPQAMYASEDVGFIDPDGQVSIAGRRIADRPAGRFCDGRKIDCQIDYLQFCHTAKLLERFREAYQTTEYFSEDRALGTHADGVFMEQMGALTTIHPINRVVCMNRRARDSINDPGSNFAFLRTYLYFKVRPLVGWLRREK